LAVPSGPLSHRRIDFPRDIANRSDIVITMLPLGREVREVALGAGGRPGQIMNPR
jgi:3-hydroxyisobutyrate dehydrogenase-like beta-hydroxyacid dehydrogenase